MTYREYRQYHGRMVSFTLSTPFWAWYGSSIAIGLLLYWLLP